MTHRLGVDQLDAVARGEQRHAARLRVPGNGPGGSGVMFRFEGLGGRVEGGGWRVEGWV